MIDCINNQDNIVYELRKINDDKSNMVHDQYLDLNEQHMAIVTTILY